MLFCVRNFKRSKKLFLNLFLEVRQFSSATVFVTTQAESLQIEFVKSGAALQFKNYHFTIE